MADSYIGIDEPTTIDKKLDTEQLTVGANTVERERVQIAGSTATQIAPVSATDGLLVNLGANNDVTVTGSVTASLAAGTNNVGDVDVLTVPAPLSTAGGGTEAAALRVTLANDSTGVVSVDDNGGSLTVDGTVAVSSVPAPLSTTGGGLEATALRVTLASDSTGVVSVDDNGGSLTVDGTVTANLAAGTNNIGDVDVLTLPALPAGDNAIGRVKLTDGTDVADVLDLTNSNPLTVAIVDGAGTQITSFGGGTQYTEDAAAAADPVGTVPILVRKDTPAGIASTDGDNVAQRGTNYGAAFVQVVSSSGAFIDSFGGSGGTAQADRSSFTDGTTNATPISGVYNETASDPTEDQAAAVRITAKRAIHVNLRDATGSEVSVGGGTQYDEDTASTAAEKLTMAGVVRKDTAASLVDTDGDRTVLAVDASGRLHVNGSGVTQPVSGTFWQATQPVSAASLPLPTGASTLAEQQTQTTALQLIDDAVATVAAAVPTKGLAAAGTDGTNARLLKTDASGELQVDVLTLPALVAGTANIGDVDVLTVPAPLSTTGGGTEATALRVTVASDSTGVLSVDDNGASLTVDGTVTASNTAGDVAHDSADSGNPVKVGGKAATALPTAVAANDRTNLLTDVYGRAFVRDGIQGPAGSSWAQAHEPAANTQGTTSKAAGGAGVRHVCTGLTATFTATGTAPSAAEVAVRLRDGATGAGTVLWAAKLSLPATAGASVGITRSGLWIVGTAATAMTLEFSAAGGANTTQVVSLEGVDIAE